MENFPIIRIMFARDGFLPKEERKKILNHTMCEPEFLFHTTIKYTKMRDPLSRESFYPKSFENSDGLCHLMSWWRKKSRMKEIN